MVHTIRPTFEPYGSTTMSFGRGPMFATKKETHPLDPEAIVCSARVSVWPARAHVAAFVATPFPDTMSAFFGISIARITEQS